MIEIIALSTAVAFSYVAPDMQFPNCDNLPKNSKEFICIKPIKCQAFLEVVESVHTEAGAKCKQDWEQYYKAEKDSCSKGSCLTVYITPPDCTEERIALSRRLIGLCDDGVVRWQAREG